MKTILALLALLFVGQLVTHAEPFDRVPRIKQFVEVVAPEVYNVKITLTDGKVVETERVALTEASLSRRLTLNSVDKTVRLMPKGGTERITLNVSEIEKIEFTKVKDEVKPVPMPAPKSYPQPGIN